jgi:hypothetical protein
MKLSPLIVFLILLFSLVISIIFQQWLSRNSTDNANGSKIWSISEYDFSKIWGNMEGYTNQATTYSDLVTSGKVSTTSGSSSTATPKQLNISPVYDISKSVVNNPKKATLYYDSSGQLINFPKNMKAYDDLGNLISSPTVLGFMTDEYGNPLDMNVYDANNKVIKNIGDYRGPVYDSYHNLIYFPYIDENGEYVVSPIMTPEIFQSYISYVSGTNKNYSDISCAYGCADYSKSLDDYISDYYQNFWNEHKQVYSDDYVLKSSVVPQNNTYDVRYNWDRNDWNDSKGLIGSLGSGLHDAASTVGKDIKTVGSELYGATKTVGGDVKELGGDIYDATKSVGGDVRELGGDIYDTTKSVGGDIYSAAKTVGKDVHSLISTIGNDGKEIAGTIGSGLSVTPTNIYGSNVNNRGMAGNYNGDNSVSNMGYLSGTNQFSTIQPAGVANFNNNYNAVPVKDSSSNFLPITADFSKFGR